MPLEVQRDARKYIVFYTSGLIVWLIKRGTVARSLIDSIIVGHSQVPRMEMCQKPLASSLRPSRKMDEAQRLSERCEDLDRGRERFNIDSARKRRW